MILRIILFNELARSCAPQAKEGAPIFFRACARRAASAGVCRGSALAAGRPPGGNGAREEMMPTSSYSSSKFVYEKTQDLERFPPVFFPTAVPVLTELSRARVIATLREGRYGAWDSR